MARSKFPIADTEGLCKSFRLAWLCLIIRPPQKSKKWIVMKTAES